MKLIDVINIQREEGEIFYRRHFHGTAVLELPLKTVETPIKFIIEMTPLGSKHIDIDFEEKIDYPLLPVLKSLRTFLEQKDTEGGLPL